MHVTLFQQGKKRWWRAGTGAGPTRRGSGTWWRCQTRDVEGVKQEIIRGIFIDSRKWRRDFFCSETLKEKWQFPGISVAAHEKTRKWTGPFFVFSCGCVALSSGLRPLLAFAGLWPSYVGRGLAFWSVWKESPHDAWGLPKETPIIEIITTPVTNVRPTKPLWSDVQSKSSRIEWLTQWRTNIKAGCWQTRLYVSAMRSVS